MRGKKNEEAARRERVGMRRSLPHGENGITVNRWRRGVTLRRPELFPLSTRRISSGYRRPVEPIDSLPPDHLAGCVAGCHGSRYAETCAFSPFRRYRSPGYRRGVRSDNQLAIVKSSRINSSAIQRARATRLSTPGHQSADRACGPENGGETSASRPAVPFGPRTSVLTPR